jgi:MFS transporter, FHS family, Na+ dependent glucose transporter 1
MHNRSSTNRPIAATTAYYLAFILLGLTTAVTGPTLPALARHTGSRIDQISLIFVTGSLGYLIGSWFGGLTYDRLPGHRVITIALLALAIATAFIPVIPSLWTLAAVIFILGFSQGVVDVGGNTLLIWIHGDGVGSYMNGLHFFFGVGALLSPIVVTLVVQATGDIHWIYWLFSLAAIPVAVWTWFLASPSPREKSTSVSSIHAYFTVVFLVVLFLFLYVGAEVGYGNWIFTYTTTLQLGTPISAAYLTSAFWGFFTLGRLAGIPISTRVEPNKILFADLIGCLLSLSLIIVGAKSSEILRIGTIALGICMASIFPTMLTLAERKLHMTGSVTGWFLVGAGLGGMFLPWIIGQTFVSIGPQVVMKLIFMDVSANLIILVIIAGRFNLYNKSLNPRPTLEKTA